ncbi:LOW QUALITY PROTEIN: BCAP29 isoform 6 [Pongo abelii]|uniref:B-cell receptor-associated protein n=3 Tax=Pongo abelii TaxID=9601 RepID=A0A2J8TA61_PONAB|nr:LOW QUALITY PROTEIN: BCAP29 isoform 2 [Pongo abelii]PNJ29927.1 LOW QUALITY PROTEIN: BCAP29 isoform 6 [Pongo abelii]
MTLQWAAVATFLYAEIGLILIFCLPFIPPQRWQKIFSFNVWGKIATFWNKAFLTIIILLIVLFLDAVREVRKYSSVHTIEKSSTSRPDAYEHTQMKLFRSQRNLYISGFSLFFWLVLRRLVTLITQLAKELSNKGVLKTQAENTNKAAKKFMEENEKLKRILKSHGKDEECVLEAENKKLVEDQQKLKTELRKTSDALSKAQNDVMEMKMQSERLSKEYDQLLKEHSELQHSSFGEFLSKRSHKNGSIGKQTGSRKGSFRKRQQEKTVNFIKDVCNILCQNVNFVTLASRKFKFRKMRYDWFVIFLMPHIGCIVMALSKYLMMFQIYCKSCIPALKKNISMLNTIFTY